MNSLSLDKVQIIELDCAYSTIEKPETQKIIAALFSMRKLGYSSRHIENSLPVDTCDFIGTHYIFTNRNTGLVLGGFRRVTFERAKFYHLDFPLFSVLKSAEAHEHLNAVAWEIESLSPQDRDQCEYISSWTMHPEVRQYENGPEMIKLLTTLTNVKSKEQHAYGNRYCFGAPRLKSDLYISWLGYERVKINGIDAESIKQKNLSGEIAVLFKLNQYTDETKAIASELTQLWENRLIIPMEQANQNKVA